MALLERPAAPEGGGHRGRLAAPLAAGAGRPRATRRRPVAGGLGRAIADPGAVSGLIVAALVRATAAEQGREQAHHGLLRSRGTWPWEHPTAHHLDRSGCS